MIVERNAALKSNSSARLKLHQELKGRYILDLNHPLFAAFLQEWRTAKEDTSRIQLVYALFCLNDRTVYCTCLEWLFPKLRKSPALLRLDDLKAFYQSKIEEHPEIGTWSLKTLECVAQKFLASIRDFGFATGTVKKVSARPTISAAAIRFLVRALKLQAIPDRELISHEAFKIFGIAQSEVVDVLSSLHKDGQLRFRMQADIIEIGGLQK